MFSQLLPGLSFCLRDSWRHDERASHQYEQRDDAGGFVDLACSGHLDRFTQVGFLGVLHGLGK